MEFLVYQSVEDVQKMREYTKKVVDHFDSEVLAEKYLNSRGDMAKDKLKATIKNKSAKASNGRQTKAQLEQDVSDALAASDAMEATDSRHGMKTFKQKGTK